MAEGGSKGGSCDTCRLQHILDLDLDDRADVELALKCAIDMRELRERQVGELDEIADEFIRLNCTDSTMGAGTSMISFAGYTASSSQVASLVKYLNFSGELLSQAAQYGQALTFLGSIGYGLSQSYANMTMKKLQAKLKRFLLNDSKESERLAEKIKVLQDHPKLCLLHNQNATVSRFIKVFGLEDADSARYWSRVNNPDENVINIVMYDEGSNEEGPCVDEEVNVKAMVNLAEGVLFTSDKAANMLKLVLPVAADMIINYDKQSAVYMAMAHGGLAACKELTLSEMTAQYCDKIAEEGLKCTEASQVLSPFGCTVGLSRDGLPNCLSFNGMTEEGKNLAKRLWNLARSKGAHISHKGGKINVCTSKENFKELTKTCEVFAKEAAPEFCKGTTKIQALQRVTDVMNVAGMTMSAYTIVSKLMQESLQGNELKAAASRMKEALETKKLLKLEASGEDGDILESLLGH